MNPELFTYRKVRSRHYEVLDETGAPLTNDDGEPLRFKSATEAKAEIAASIADTDAEPAAEMPGSVPESPPEASQTVSGTGYPGDTEIASLDRAERLRLGTLERDALRAWRATGDVDPCNRPHTPILDFLADPTAKPKATRHPKVPVRSEAQDAELVRIITEGRVAGLSWSKVADQLNEAKIPTPRGGPWWDTTASDAAKRLTLVV